MAGVPLLPPLELTVVVELAGIGPDRPVGQRAEAGLHGLLVAVEGGTVALQGLAKRARLGVYRRDALARVLHRHRGPQPPDPAYAGQGGGAGPEDVEQRGGASVAPDLFDHP